MECSRCNQPAITYIRYSGEHLCKEHFKNFFETRVFKEFRKQVDIGRGKKVAVAVSGGKDSIVALRIIHKILGERRDSEIYGITIDEGIEGYRPKSLKIAEDEYEKLGIEYDIVSFKDRFDLPLDKILEQNIGMPCSVCGVLRRWIMNKMAKEAGADFLATGLNLDDTSQSILMNFCRADIEKLARLGPHKKVKEGLVPRIAPLRNTPEKESYLYAMVSDMEIHEQECPYSDEALRGLYRDIIGQLEDNTPGARFAILSSYDKLEDMLRKEFSGDGELQECVSCGEPTINEKCKTCKLVDKLVVERG
ncbi:MAG: TIGR00269 family protein [Thermoplasmata archaeon]